MIILLQIVLIFLYALHDHFVIKSYGDSWNDKYKDWWHYVKFCFVTLTGYLACGFSYDLVVFYLLYYVLFSAILNILRGKKLLYLGSSGSDGWRNKIFGKRAILMEGIFKAVAIIGIVLIEVCL